MYLTKKATNFDFFADNHKTKNPKSLFYLPLRKPTIKIYLFFRKNYTTNI